MASSSLVPERKSNFEDAAAWLGAASCLNANQTLGGELSATEFVLGVLSCSSSLAFVGSPKPSQALNDVRRPSPSGAPPPWTVIASTSVTVGSSQVA